jgi:drug/metabolite transporter (DMT)-like permease
MTSIPFWIVSYIGTALAITITKQYLSIYGVSDQSTLLVTQVTFLAYTIAGTDLFGSTAPPTPPKSPKESSSFYIALYVAALIIGTALLNIGLSMTGSGIYQVLYSSVTIDTAIISYFTLGKKKNFIQICGILTIFLGLAWIPYLTTSGADSKQVLFGSLITILGTIFIAITYILDELIVTNYDRFHLTDKDLCFQTGFLCLVTLFVYQYVVIWPNWTKVTSSITDWRMVLILLAFQLVSNGFKSVAYYVLINSIGSVGCGVLQGLISVGVFGTSAYLFCSIQTYQCFTIYKGFSSLFVVVGIISYSIGSGTMAVPVTKKTN